MTAWLAARHPPPRPRPVIAIDGETARGARSGDARATYLLAAFDTTTGRHRIEAQRCRRGPCGCHTDHCERCNRKRRARTS